MFPRPHFLFSQPSHFRTSQETCTIFPIRIDKSPPVIRAREDPGAVIIAESGGEPGISNSQSITVEVTDTISGPRKFEVFKVVPSSGNVLLAENSTVFDGTHIYSAADSNLGILGDLPDGEIVLKATDQGGNESSVSFMGDRECFVDGVGHDSATG